MSQLFELNFAAYDLNEDSIKISPENREICICCLTKGEAFGLFVSLVNCNHVGFFDKFFKYKIEYAEAVICNQCHDFLKKIHRFQKQVEESFVVLKEQSHSKINSKPKLQRSKIEISSAVNSQPITFEIKPETITSTNQHSISSTNHNAEYETTTEVKIEQDSDLETDLPLSDLKKSKKRKTKDTKRGRRNETKNVTEPVANKLYQGKICMVTLSREEMMLERERDRVKEAYLKLPFKCKDCVTGFDHEQTLRDHLEKRHTERKGSFPCNICKSVLNSEPSYKEHYKRHFRRYVCEACGKRNNTLLAVVKHYNELHGAVGTMYSCEDCDYTTKLHRQFRYHRDKHRARPQCAHCGHRFVNKAGLKVHMYTVHKHSARVYSCEPCHKVYNAKSGLLAHVEAKHSGAHAYCAQCQTHFRTESGLRTHLRTHSRHVSDTDKRFICDECGRKFMTKPALQEHIDWVHLNTAKYSCNKCSKTFKNGSALKKHRNFVHEKKRPPRNKICDHCGRGFTTLSILRSHIRTHTGERPLQCAHCAATFAHSAALYTHNRLLHSGRR